MTPSPSKRKGTRWERDLVKELEGEADAARRVAGSGALGTILGDPYLSGDVSVVYEFFPKPFKIEAKYGYGGSTQMTVKRAWMEKIREEAARDGSLPAVSIKFKNVTTGDPSAKWICFSIEDWNRLVKHLNTLFEDLEDFWKWKYESQKSRRKTRI